MAIRSVLFGTCLLKGIHPPGSKLARECPVLKRQARREQAQKASLTRWRAPGTPPGASEGLRA